MNGHPALVLIDLQTIRGDHLSAQFVYLYKLPVVKIKRKTLSTAMKVSKGTIDKTCEEELDWGGDEETCMIYVEHLLGWHMILGKPALRNILATISPGTEPVTMQPTGMYRFSLRMWGGNQVTDPKSDL